MNKNQQDIADLNLERQKEHAAREKERREADQLRTMERLRADAARDAQDREERTARPLAASSEKAVPVTQTEREGKGKGGFIGFLVLIGVIAFVVHAVTKNDSASSSDPVAPVHTSQQQQIAPLHDQPAPPVSTGDVGSSGDRIEQPDSEQANEEYEKWVKGDIGEYITASNSNFEQYKTGTPQMINGHEVWTAQKPLFADSCQIVAMTTNILTCQLDHFKTLQEAESAYAQLLGYVYDAVPTWTKTANPFAAEVKSTGLLSSELGLEGEIWIHSDPDKPEWSLHYEISKSS